MKNARMLDPELDFGGDVVARADCLRLLLWGGTGLMGKSVQQHAGDQGALEITAAPGRGEDPPPPQDWDMLLDFSTPEGSMEALRLAVQYRKPLVCGVTGHSPEQRQEFERAARQIPVLLEANFSPGVALLRHLVRAAAAAFPKADVSLWEVHREGKLDKPSGTAKVLRSEVGKGAGAAAAERVHVESVRRGDEECEHHATFRLPGEILELRHRVENRDHLAKGALGAALRLRDRKPGMYGMADVLT